MRYKIGEVSKLLNMPVETIRYFESKNLISPKRSENSNYREYETWDIYYLFEYKSKELIKLIEIQMEQTKQKFFLLEQSLEHNETIPTYFRKMLESSLSHHL